MIFKLLTSLIWIYNFEVIEMAKGFDASAKITNEQFLNFSTNGYSFFIGRIYRSNATGMPDIDGITNINKARETGFLDVDGYIYPCTYGTCRYAIDQVNTALNVLEDEKATVGKIWLDIENPEKWSKNFTKNRQFIDDMASTVKGRGYSAGIYTSKYSWVKICGNWTAYSSYPLWWVAYNKHEDLKTGWMDFGGWISPMIHQWDQNYIENKLKFDPNVK
uniref:Lysozyme n=1 Tax=Panagrolaimus sp. ES5 TaxID=591445 RepID=A0AC34EZS2_9BILA